MTQWHYGLYFNKNIKGFNQLTGYHVDDPEFQLNNGLKTADRVGPQSSAKRALVQVVKERELIPNQMQ